jgi:hypothetical protein
MIDDETIDDWRPTEQRPLTFERRISEMLVPRMEQEGLAGVQPDLVIMASLFWDDSLFRDVRAVRSDVCFAGIRERESWR